jgi:hypothetical protein
VKQTTRKKAVKYELEFGKEKKRKEKTNNIHSRGRGE